MCHYPQASFYFLLNVIDDFFCDHFCSFFEIYFLAVYSWLAWNSLCQFIWPQTLGQSSSCHVFNIGVTSGCHDILWIFNLWSIKHFKNSTDSWAWFHMSLIEAFQSQRQVDLCESKPSLVYRAGPMIARDTKRNNVSKIKKINLIYIKLSGINHSVYLKEQMKLYFSAWIMYIIKLVFINLCL